MSEIADKLKNVSLFSELSKRELEAIAGLMQTESHAKGVKIFQEGEPGDALYIIDTGSVRISKNIPGVGEEALAVLEAGSVFGEMALIDDAPRSADAIAHTDVALLVMYRNEFESMLFVDKELAYHVLSAMLRVLAARLRETNDKISAFFAMTKFG